MRETYCVVLTEYNDKNKIAYHYINYYEGSTFESIIDSSPNHSNEYEACSFGLLKAYSLYGDIIYIINFDPKDKDFESIKLIISKDILVKKDLKQYSPLIRKIESIIIDEKNKDDKRNLDLKLKQYFNNNETYLFIQKINLNGGIYKYLVYAIKNGIIIDKFIGSHIENLNKIYDFSEKIHKEEKKSIINQNILTLILEKLFTKNYFNYDIKICIGGETMSSDLSKKFPLLKFDHEKYMSSKWLIKFMNSNLNNKMKNNYE